MSLWTGEDQSSLKCKEGADWGAEEWVTSEQLEQALRRGHLVQLEKRRACRRLTASLQTHFALAKVRAMPVAVLSQELFVGANLGHGFLGEKSQGRTSLHLSPQVGCRGEPDHSHHKHPGSGRGKG